MKNKEKIQNKSQFVLLFILALGGASIQLNAMHEASIKPAGDDEARSLQNMQDHLNTHKQNMAAAHKSILWENASQEYKNEHDYGALLGRYSASDFKQEWYHQKVNVDKFISRLSESLDITILQNTNTSRSSTTRTVSFRDNSTGNVYEAIFNRVGTLLDVKIANGMKDSFHGIYRFSQLDPNDPFLQKIKEASNLSQFDNKPLNLSSAGDDVYDFDSSSSSSSSRTGGSSSAASSRNVMIPEINSFDFQSDIYSKLLSSDEQGRVQSIESLGNNVYRVTFRDNSFIDFNRYGNRVNQS